MARYIDFMDMIDGGGAGKMGGEFEGGGLLSVLANAFATPYGSEDEERRKRLMQSRGLLDMSAPPAPPSAAQTKPSPAPSYATMDMGEAGRGAPTPPPAPAYANMPMGEAGRGVAPNPLADMSAMDAMAMMRNAPNQQPVPFGGFQTSDPFQQAAQALAGELGNAFYMMPMEEQLMRIQQRVDQMRGM